MKLYRQDSRSAAVHFLPMKLGHQSLGTFTGQASVGLVPVSLDGQGQLVVTSREVARTPL